MVEYWGGPSSDYGFPKNIKFEHKIDTDLYDFAKVCKVRLNVIYLEDITDCV